MKRTQEFSPILLEYAVIFVFDQPLPLTECGRDHAPICIASHEDDAIDQAGRPAVGDNLLFAFALERFDLDAMEIGTIRNQ